MQGLCRQWSHQGWPPILVVSKAVNTGKGSVTVLGCDLCPKQSQPGNYPQGEGYMACLQSCLHTVLAIWLQGSPETTDFVTTGTNWDVAFMPQHLILACAALNFLTRVACPLGKL